MENASKALIIAGAVLIAIVLISIGVKLIADSKPAIDSQEKASKIIEANSFNSTFQKYSGKQKGSALKQIFSDKRAVEAQFTGHTVTISGVSEADIRPYNNYTVTIGGTDDNGYITSVTISE